MVDIHVARRRLELRRDELARRVSRAEAGLRHEAQPLSADPEEQAVERGNEDVLRNIDIDARESLRRVNHALDRLDSGRYLECERCGRSIEPARHDAIPEADRCAACAASAETGR